MKNASFQIKRGSTQRWIEVDPILLDGEPAYDYDVHKIKIGNGVNKWSELPYLGGSYDDNAELIYPFDSYDKLPIVGTFAKLYHVISDKTIYQWNPIKNTYESLSGGDATKITLINGGNANG